MNCLYVLEIKPLLFAQSANIFSHSVCCLFILLMVSFSVQKLVGLNRSHLFIFAFISFALGDWPNKILLRFMSKNVFPRFSSRSFMMSHLIPRPYIFYVTEYVLPFQLRVQTRSICTFLYSVNHVSLPILAGFPFSHSWAWLPSWMVQESLGLCSSVSSCESKRGDTYLTSTAVFSLPLLLLKIWLAQLEASCWSSCWPKSLSKPRTSFEEGQSHFSILPPQVGTQNSRS